MTVAPIPCQEPSQFAAGDSLSWTKSLADYQIADGWSLIYSFRGNAAKLDVASTVLNSDHLISLTSAQTALLVAGLYYVAGYAVNGVQRIQIFNGRIRVTPNLQIADDSFDGRSQHKRDLDTALATRSTLLAISVQDSDVEGTRLRRRELEDLNKTIDRLQVAVHNEEIKLLQAQGKPTGRTIFGSFTRPRFDGYTGQL